VSVRFLIGDAGSRLKQLPDESVHMVCTSPPYFGLRDYGTAQWEGGDPACDHQEAVSLRRDSPGGFHNSTSRGTQAATVAVARQLRSVCGKCGARRIDSQIGIEATPSEYVAELVAVFREVRRVLRSDGVCWLNLGDSFSSGVPNIPDLLARRLEGDVLFFGRADPRGRSAERVHVLIYDKAAPNPIFKPLFRAQRVLVKNRQDDLCQIGGALNAPVTVWVDGVLRLDLINEADSECAANLPENVAVIITGGELCSNPSLRDVVASSALAIKHAEAPFAVKVSREPVAEGITSDVSVWNSVTLNAGSVSIPHTNAINEPVALFDRAKLRAGGGRDLTIRNATAEHVSLSLERRCELRFQSVAQLFLLHDGGLTPYRTALAEAKKYWNANRQKQEFGIPEMAKRALMEDGWICRQTIIWEKPNPMPESVTDRCTKSHEYVFLLTKSASYFYDSAAIAEPFADDRMGNPGAYKRTSSKAKGAVNDRQDLGFLNNGDGWNSDGSRTVRNRRSVWTIATEPSSLGHFALMPTALAELCIKAGTSERGCCPLCGKGWVRVVERGQTTRDGPTASGWREIARGDQASVRRLGETQKETLGWRPSCSCSSYTTEADAAVMLNFHPVPATVLDPFAGAGTTGLVADRLGRNAILIELNHAYAAMARTRLEADAGMFTCLEAAE
jgi:DNA modification methylase